MDWKSYRSFSLSFAAFEGFEMTTVSAAILCPAVCVSDVIRKARLYGKSINYFRNPAFFALIGKGSKPAVFVPGRAQIQSKNMLL